MCKRRLILHAPSSRFPYFAFAYSRADLAATDASQGPEFTELAEDLQESFQNYVAEECGVDEDVTAFISMYCDYREQEEYVSWMKTAIDILD
jgi:hypothetical protein